MVKLDTYFSPLSVRFNFFFCNLDLVLLLVIISSTNDMSLSLVSMKSDV